MAVLEGGSSGVVAEVGAASAKGLHVIAKPHDYGSLGHYSIGMRSGVIAAALGANSEVFQFRWTDATRLALIRRVRVAAAVSTTFFAAGVPMTMDMLKATGWSAAGSGGTRASPAALLKRRTSMGSTLVAASDIGISSTGALTAGTKTLETLAIASILAACPITASLYGPIIPPNTSLFEAETGDGDHPLTLVQNEGFVITIPTIPATGTWTLAVSVSWSEVTAF